MVLISERGLCTIHIMMDVYEEHVLDNDIIDDCLDNYTDFVSKNEISIKMVQMCGIIMIYIKIYIIIII